MSAEKVLGPMADSPLTTVRGIGPVRSEALASAGLHCLRDLLFVLPFRYEDRRLVASVGEIERPGPYTLIGKLDRVKAIRIRRRRLSMVRARLSTESGEIPVVWFNRPYLSSQVSPDIEYLLHGAVRSRADCWELVNPSLEALEKARLAGRIVPVYPSVGKVPPSQIRTFISELLHILDPNLISEKLPERLLREHGLPSIGEALEFLHRPPVDADVESLNQRSTPEHQRLIYGEALEIQAQLAIIRRHGERIEKAHRYSLKPEGRQRLEDSLPFVLTGAQQRVFSEILSDLESPFPMARLLQGDVGSGKTAVAALALAAAAESGLQGALMAPTELLAEQHYVALRKLLRRRYSMVLLTASAANLKESRRSLEAGETCLAVGTHALIQQSVRFSDLGLVVIDEQHRFGVAQRRDLQHKGDRPDLLVMTATPIPRSLTLTVYGDLALSVIDELPPGRSAVTTRLVPQRERDQVYEWLADELARGARAYIVLPLIEESSKIAAESVAGLGQRLARQLRRFQPATLHGRTPPDERASIMRAFAAGEARVLIATTLIEVGVDVPDATIMVIESAERFGLSQLHQLRGRVGRGDSQSFCTAIYGRASEESHSRLEVFARSLDGFQIAEADLEIRGPGDLLGTRQSGLPAFRFLNLVRDRGWIEKARKDALEMVDSRPDMAERLASERYAMAAYDQLAGA